MGEPGLPAKAFESLPKRYDKVIVLLIDAFGWRFFERYQERYPFLKRFVQEGVVSKLTTQFPSTTSAHVTTIHSGLPVGEHGIYEWNYYEPIVDSIIAPLLYSFAGTGGRGNLAWSEMSPQQYLPSQTLYKRLAEAGVRSTVFGSRNYTPSPYSNVVTAGAELVGYQTVSEALTNLTERVIADTGPSYYFLYADEVDGMGHTYGPDSPQFGAEVDTMMTVLERLLHGKLAGATHDTLLLVTADHGQVAVDPATTIYLNHAAPSIESLIQRNRKGELLVPAGSARDMFLHIRADALDEAQALLTPLLAGRAEVYLVSQLIQDGFFGTAPLSDVFLNRVGNLLILPYEGESVWWYEAGRYAMNFRGHHGGLARGEMETQLLALPYL